MLNDKQIKELERQAIIAALFRICDPRSMENLKKGDTVQLKSGGPIMTVGAEAFGGGLFCDWFNGTEHKQAAFYEEQLKKVEPREPEQPAGSSGFRTY